MKNLFIILFLIPVFLNAQQGVIVRNDTLFSFDPGTGIYTQINKQDTSAMPGFTDKVKGLITWLNMAGKPSTYTPATHNHVKANITDFGSYTNTGDTALMLANYKAAMIANTAGLLLKVNITDTSGKWAASVHTHTLSSLGLGNINNTSDASKPVSTAQQTALDLKANISTTPSIVASINATGQTANIGTATLYAVPSAGFYRISIYITVTSAGTTSTMPSTTITYTDGNSGTNTHSTTTTATNAGNSVTTTFLQTTYNLYAKASTNIQYATASYASTGGTSMQYALRIRVEAL